MIKNERRKNDTGLYIKHSEEQQMIVYKPDEFVQTKVNLCDEYITGDVMNCKMERGTIICNGEDENCSDDAHGSDEECDEVDSITEMEENDLSTENIFEMISSGSVTALFS